MRQRYFICIIISAFLMMISFAWAQQNQPLAQIRVTEQGDIEIIRLNNQSEISDIQNQNPKSLRKSSKVDASPDLTYVLSECSISYSAPNLTIHVRVINNGSSASVGSMVGYYITGGYWVDEWFDDDYVPPLSPGEYEDCTDSENMSYHTDYPGFYEICFRVDYLDDVAESDETNNYYKFDGTIPVGDPYPDLTITDIEVLDSEGPEIKFQATMKNIGNKAAGSGYKNLFYLSEDKTITSEDYYIYDWNVEDAIGIDQYKYSWEIISTISGVPAGSYYLGVIADGNNDVYEINENNNKACAASPMINIVDESGFSINIDGLKDDFYNTLTGPDDGYLQLRSYAWNGNGIPDNDADLSAKIWTAWDEDWLYIYEEVKDNVLSGNSTDVWANDCFELNVDPQPTSTANSVWACRLTALSQATAGVVGDDNLNTISDSDKQYVRKTISGGYALEMAVKWSAIQKNSETVTPAVGNIFGAAINQHDNDGNARRDATVQWAAVMSNDVWQNPAYHGTVTFLSDNKLKFEAENHFEGTANPIPYDGSDYNRTDVQKDDIKPLSFNLEQNHPNPFNPSTRILFSIDSPSKVRIEIFDLLGRCVRTFGKMQCSPGAHEMIWDGMDSNGQSAESGIYFIVLTNSTRSLSKKMIKLE